MRGWSKNHGQEFVKVIYPEEQYIFTEPKGLDKEIPIGFQKKLHHMKDEEVVTVIPNGRFFGDGDRSAVITPNNKLIWEVCREKKRNNIKAHWVFRQKRLPGIEYYEGNIALLSTLFHENYYHWTYQALPRLDLLRKSGIEIDKYIVPQFKHPFHEQTLDALGISKERIIFNNKNLHLGAKRLIVTSTPPEIPKWVCDFLKMELMIKRNIQPSKAKEKIYISRSNAYYRRIINEKEVIDYLQSKGFKIMHLEKFSIDEQIKIFASAEVVVAPHGAGLTNLAFCNPGTKVIEIFAPYYMVFMFWMISNHCGLDYYYLLGELNPTLKEQYLRIGDRKRHDILVDISELAKIAK